MPCCAKHKCEHLGANRCTYPIVSAVANSRQFKGPSNRFLLGRAQNSFPLCILPWGCTSIFLSKQEGASSMCIHWLSISVSKQLDNYLHLLPTVRQSLYLARSASSKAFCICRLGQCCLQWGLYPQTCLHCTFWLHSHEVCVLLCVPGSKAHKAKQPRIYGWNGSPINLQPVGGWFWWQGNEASSLPPALQYQ